MSTEAPAAPAAPSITPATPAAPSTSPPADTPSSPSAPLIGADGSLGENWFTALGDEFAPHAADLGKYKNLRDLVSQYRFFQKNGVEYPGADAPAAAVDRFRQIAGVPQDPAGYGLTAEAMKLPEDMTFDSELAQVISGVAHAHHTPPAALMAIAGKFNEVLAARTEAARQETARGREAAKAALIDTWKGDFQANASTVRHLAGQLAQQAGIAPDDPMMAGFMENISTQPALARMMHAMSKLIAEDNVTAPGGFGSLKSPAQQLEDIKAGRDPVWSPRMTSKDERERLAAYEHMKGLREKAGQ